MKLSIAKTRDHFNLNLSLSELEYLLGVIYYTSPNQRASIGISENAEQLLRDLRTAYKEVYFD